MLRKNELVGIVKDILRENYVSLVGGWPEAYNEEVATKIVAAIHDFHIDLVHKFVKKWEENTD